jgi:hypothetical protein
MKKTFEPKTRTGIDDALHDEKLEQMISEMRRYKLENWV